METEGRLSTFSLVEYYSGNPHAHFFDLLIVFILGLLILGTPLPFGSVQYLPVAAIEFLATVAFLVWIYKLVFCGNPELLAEFRELYMREAGEFARLPFFHRHYWLARVFRILTLGFWPRKNVAQNLIEDGSVAAPRRLRYYNLFGFPVKKTGIETLALLFLLLLILQLIPLPSPLLRILSPSTADLYHTAFQTTGKSVNFFPISLDSFATFERLLRYTAYLIVFAVVVNNIRTRILFSVILYCIFISAVFQGVYGLYEVLSGHQHIFEYRKIYNTDSATGTFINRNHYACYLELAIPLLITVTVGRFASLRSFRGNIFVRISHALETQGSQLLLLVMMMILVGVALIFSLSRSGISFGMVSVILFFFLYWKAKGRLTRKSYLSLGVAATAALVVWIGLRPVIERFLSISQNWQDEGARWDVWKSTFNVFLHFPLAGTGAGTFEEIFPMYRTFVHHVLYDYAHNDYLQFLSETGVFCLLLMIGLFDLLVERMSRILSLREFNRLAVIQLGAFCSLLSLALHSITDFSIQIPAVAIQSCIIAGLLFSNYHAENRGISR